MIIGSDVLEGTSRQVLGGILDDYFGKMNQFMTLFILVKFGLYIINIEKYCWFLDLN